MSEESPETRKPSGLGELWGRLSKALKRVDAGGKTILADGHSVLTERQVKGYKKWLVEYGKNLGALHDEERRLREQSGADNIDPELWAQYESEVLKNLPPEEPKT